MKCVYQGDARYLISNSKDQSIKLWDIRKFSPKEGLAASRLAVTQQNWDYRWQQVPQRGEEPSVVKLDKRRSAKIFFEIKQRGPVKER